jgi:hypothetical protein
MARGVLSFGFVSIPFDIHSAIEDHSMRLFAALKQSVQQAAPREDSELRRKLAPRRKPHGNAGRLREISYGEQASGKSAPQLPSRDLNHDKHGGRDSGWLS